MESCKFIRVLERIADKLYYESKIYQMGDILAPTFEDLSDAVLWNGATATWEDDHTVSLGRKGGMIYDFPCFPILVLEDNPLFKTNEEGQILPSTRVEKLTWTIKGFESIKAAEDYVEQGGAGVGSKFFYFYDRGFYKEIEGTYYVKRPDGSTTDIDFIEWWTVPEDRNPNYEYKFRLDTLCELIMDRGTFIYGCRSECELYNILNLDICLMVMEKDVERVEGGFALFKGRQYPFTIICDGVNGFVDFRNIEMKCWDNRTYRFERGYD